MTSEDLKKQVNVEGVYIYDINRTDGAGVVKFLARKHVTVEDLLQGLMAVNKRIDRFNEAKEGMEKLISKAIKS